MTDPLTPGVLVVGAGPAGLATSRALARKDVPHVVLERGDRVGHTWTQFYDSLTLHTAKRLSALPDRRFAKSVSTFPTRNDVVAYLDDYAREFALPVKTGMDVVSLTREGDLWVARTRAGDAVSAPVAVVATGIAANPVLPAIEGLDRFRGVVIHSVEYRRPRPFAGQRVLVIGAGNSAGEIATELALAGVATTIAMRSGATLLPRSVLGVPIQYLGLALDAFPRSVQRRCASALRRASALLGARSPVPPPPDAQCPRVPLIGLRLGELLRSGRLGLRPGVDAFTPEGARFAGGTAESFDAVILATGYRAALDFLNGSIGLDPCGFARRRDLVKSADKADLYFVGHNYGIRGSLHNIARDARVTARDIVRGNRQIRQPAWNVPNVH